MNVETCGHVADLTVMAHAFAELRDGVVAPQHENGFKCGHNFAQTLYSLLELCSVSQLSQSSGLLSAYSQLTLSSARLEHEGDALAAADARRAHRYLRLPARDGVGEAGGDRGLG